jgi:hypothetical protein
LGSNSKEQQNLKALPINGVDFAAKTIKSAND